MEKLFENVISKLNSIALNNLLEYVSNQLNMGVSADDIIKELSKKINKYEKEHSCDGIITCDIDDVWNWIEKTEKKLNKKASD